MAWWTNIVNTAIAAKDAVINTVSYAWSWIAPPITTTASYGFNTSMYILENVAATRRSLPALSRPNSQNVLQAVKEVSSNRLLHLIALNTVTNLLCYCLAPSEKESEDYAVATYYSTTTLLSWGIWLVSRAYTEWESTELLGETFVIDTAGARTCLSHKKERTQLPATDICVVKNCSYTQGTVTESFLLIINDLLTYGVSFFPVVGKYMEFALKTYFTGGYINRAVNLHCEEHKTIDPSLRTALGINHVAKVMLLSYLFEKTIGVPSFLVFRTLQHVILLWDLNVAAHMEIPYAEPQRSDPVALFERGTTILLNVQFAGTLFVLKQLLTTPSKKPIISLPKILQTLTHLLNEDRVHTETSQPQLFKSGAKKLIPPTYRSTQDAINNPVLRIFWPDIRELMLTIMHYIIKADATITYISNRNVLKVASAIKKLLPAALAQFGVPTKATTIFLRAAKEDDFAPCLMAFQGWLTRHKLHESIGLCEIEDPSEVSGLYQGENKEHEAEPKAQSSSPMMQVETEEKKTRFEVSVANRKSSGMFVGIDSTSDTRNRWQKSSATKNVPINASLMTDPSSSPQGGLF